ncbi:MAG: AbrB/MazE/SpoVT family DNA-binding domain-containing protein [Jiangellaceae bacterium]
MMRPLRRQSGTDPETQGVLPLAWYCEGMRTTIDKAGRLVLPKPLRDRIGLHAGAVDVFVDGAGLRVEPVARDDLEERDGRLVVRGSGAPIDDDTVQALRDADQR